MIENNPSHLTLPDNQAALAPFPPGCSVLVVADSGSGSNSAGSSPQTYLGQVHSVYIDLGSATRDNFYRVRPSSAAAPAAAAEEDTELRSVAESDLKYAPGCTVTVNTSALPPFLAEGGGGDTRDATIISCVGGGASGSSNYYLLDVMPGPNDSWANIQSTVPVDSVRYRAPPVVEDNGGQDGDQDNRAINEPHPHMIPADEDGSSLNSTSNPPVAAIAFDTKNSRKRPAQLDTDDGNSSTLSPMPTDGSASVASGNAIAEEVVRRIDIPDTVDASKVKSALVGPECKINERMQAKFKVIISILGLDDAVVSSAVESFAKLGPISYKVGDQCIMIQGSERRVHDAARVVIHMLVNKCYEGNDKDALMRRLRVVRQVRKKAEPSPSRASARPDLPSPKKKIKTGPTVAKGDAASLAAVAKDPIERGWSPPIEDDSQPQIGSTGSAQNQLPGLLRDPIWVEKDGSSYWQSDVISSLPETELFGRIIGGGGENKKRLEHKFSRVFFSIRGKGIQLKTGMQSEGPLRVEVGGNIKEEVSLAAQHIAKIIHFDPINDRVPTDSACRPLSRPLKHSKYSEAPREIFNNNGSLFGEPTYRDKVWSVQVRSMIDERNLFKSFIGTQYKIRSRLIDRFHLSHIGILKDGGNQRLLIEGGDKVGVIEAANYASDTMREMAKPVTKHFEATLSTACCWDGKRWSIDVVSPLSYDVAFGIIIGPGGSIKERLRKDLDCFSIFLRGGNGTRGENSELPPHVRITDGIRTIVEDAGDHIARLLHDAKAKRDTQSKPSNRIPRNAECDHLEPGKIGPAADLTRQSKGLVMCGPFLEGGNWVVKIRSPIEVDGLFALLVGNGGFARVKLTQRFGLNSIFIAKETEDIPLHVAIKCRERASALAAAEYVAETLHTMSLPVPTETPERIFEKCYWDGNKWMLCLRLPCTEKDAADIIIGPGGRKNAELRRKLNCFIHIEGGEMEKFPDLRRYPAHVSIRDKSRITVEEAGSFILKILREAAVRPSAQNSPHRSPEPQNRTTHAAAAGHNPHHFQQHRQQEQQYLNHHHQGPRSHHNSRNPFKADPAQPAGFGENAFWATTLWPPVGQYPYCDFYNHIVGPYGLTQRRIEQRFGVEVKLWGQQGNHREPLHIIVNGRTSHDVDAAASQIAEMLKSFACS